MLVHKKTCVIPVFVYFLCNKFRPERKVLVLFLLSNNEGSCETGHMCRLTRAVPANTHKVKMYSKTCLKRPLKNRQNKGLEDKW